MTHDTHYGEISDGITLRGVGEFAPDVVGAGTPVFAVETVNDSYLTFCFQPDEIGDEDLRVFHVHSYVPGEFSRMLNAVVQHFSGADGPQPTEVVFTVVVSEWLEGANLRERLDGFEERTVEEPGTGEEIPELVGTWDPGYDPREDD